MTKLFRCRLCAEAYRFVLLSIYLCANVLFFPFVGLAGTVTNESPSVTNSAVQSSTETVAHESPPIKKLVVQSFSLNQYVREFDGQWQGCYVASDGNCYFACSSHSDRHGAGFFRYNPHTKELSVLADDISKVCGEEPPRTVPQGKIHSPIVEANGWLYFSTHLGLYIRKGKQNYTGAHILGYELATGKFRDYGILKPRYSVYSAVGVDAEGHWLYAFVMPMCQDDRLHGGSHLFRLDLKTSKKEDLGLVQPGANDFNGCFWFFVDHHGDCWFTIGRGDGALFCARGTTGQIERWNNVLPSARFGIDHEYSERSGERYWTWAQALPDRKRCVFTMGTYDWQREISKTAFYGDEQLWIFDPSKKLESTEMWEVGEAFQCVGYIGPNFLGLALCKDRVYCVQPAVGQEEDSSIPPNTFSRSFVRKEATHFLRSLPLNATEDTLATDHGLIVDQDGRKAVFAESVAADNDGRVFMVAQFTLLPGEQNKKGILRFHNRTRTYRENDRGLFFVVANLSEDNVLGQKEGNSQKEGKVMSTVTTAKKVASRIDHIEIPAPDIGKAKRFYSTVFSWKTKDVSSQYCLFSAGPLSGGFDQNSDVQDKGILLVLRVSDIEAKLAEIREAGGEIVQGKKIYSWGCRAVFKDPNGNRLAISNDK